MKDMTKPPPAASTPTTGKAVDFWPATPMEAMKDGGPGLRCRFINAEPVGAWDDFVLSEWELRNCGWSDFHPHTETAFVLEGELHIESGGESVILRPGDSARVKSGCTGRYWAPVYARMLTTYGPNPAGAESHSFRYFEI